MTKSLKSPKGLGFFSKLHQNFIFVDTLYEWLRPRLWCWRQTCPSEVLSSQSSLQHSQVVCVCVCVSHGYLNPFTCKFLKLLLWSWKPPWTDSSSSATKFLVNVRIGPYFLHLNITVFAVFRGKSVLLKLSAAHSPHCFIIHIFSQKKGFSLSFVVVKSSDPITLGLYFTLKDQGLSTGHEIHCLGCKKMPLFYIEAQCHLYSCGYSAEIF